MVGDTGISAYSACGRTLAIPSMRFGKSCFVSRGVGTKSVPSENESVAMVESGRVYALLVAGVQLA